MHVENGGDFAIQRHGDIVYLLFQDSVGKEDWKNNFDFAAKPYKDMSIKWRCHRGFLRVWKSIEPYIKYIVEDKSVKRFIIIGYSHGAAIATLAHEYVWYNRPDLRYMNGEMPPKILGYGFGCPRVFFGRMKKELADRWQTFFPIRNVNDLITHLPPRIFGFRHVNEVVKIGDKKKMEKRFPITCVSAHFPSNYVAALTEDR